MADDNDNKPNPAEAFQKLLAKKDGDGVQLASQLFDENFQLREKNRTLAANQPKDGATVLSADEAKDFKEYKEFIGDSKLDLKQIKEQIGKVSTLETENVRLEKRDKLRDVAALGYDLDVLEERMAAYPNAEFSIKTEKDKTDPKKENKVSYIKLDGKESSLDDFAKENFPKYLPVLKVEAAQTVEKKTGTTDVDPLPTGDQSNTEAAKAAQAGQAQATHSTF